MGWYCENSVVVSGLLVAQCVFTAADLDLQSIEIAAKSFERAGNKLQARLVFFLYLGSRRNHLCYLTSIFPCNWSS